MSTPEEGHLAWHLISEHADGAAVMRPLKDNQDAHEHEHDGPGTIRNHDRLSLHYDEAKKAEVLAELAAVDEHLYDPDAILADPLAHPVHKDIALINIGVRDRGERWAKCANCGNAYQLTPEWISDTVCGEPCYNAYVDYLNAPRTW
jgi:hypothetical protein